MHIDGLFMINFGASHSNSPKMMSTLYRTLDAFLNGLQLLLPKEKLTYFYCFWSWKISRRTYRDRGPNRSDDFRGRTFTLIVKKTLLCPRDRLYIAIVLALCPQSLQSDRTRCGKFIQSSTIGELEIGSHGVCLISADTN